MKESELLNTMDARIWAEEFNRVLVSKGKQPYDTEFLIGWFANAIMAGYDIGYRKAIAETKASARIDEDEVYWILAHRLDTIVLPERSRKIAKVIAEKSNELIKMVNKVDRKSRCCGCKNDGMQDRGDIVGGAGCIGCARQYQDRYISKKKDNEK